MRIKKENTGNGQRGSATIEAVVAFTGFLLAFFTILGMVNYCRVQMRISAAVDTAARELSQYAYFYKMSGLQKFDLALGDQAAQGTERINQVLATVDGLYTSVSGAMDQSAEDATRLANAIDQGTLTIEDIQSTLSGIDENGTNIADSIGAMEMKLDEIGNNPVLYMRSLVAIAGQQGMNLAKRAIAAPLCKMFVLKHFGETEEEQNETLKALGVVGGIEGLNFKMSTMFTDEKCRDVEVVVFYTVKLSQFFDWDILEVDLCKQAVCGAWLDGDVVPELESSDQTENGDAPAADPAGGTNGEG